MDKYKVRPLLKQISHSRLVFSDASATACGGYTVGLSDSIVHRSWQPDEICKSSAWRELTGVYTVLQASTHVLRGHIVKWHTDNKAVVSIVDKGSMNKELHDIALNIFKLCRNVNIMIFMEWLPRSLNEKADYVSKIVDWDDWGVSQEFFDCLDKKWGKHTIDRFASFTNKKLPRFNTKFWTPGSLGIDAFSFDWGNEVNWLVPPIYLVPKVLRHILHCKARGTLVVPLWKSAVFWPLLCVSNGSFKNFVRDFQIFHDVRGIFIQGSVKSIFNDKFPSPVLAVKIVA